MAKLIKIGGLAVEVPDNSPLIEPTRTAAAPVLKAEKPDEPEPLEEKPCIFQPNDPFRSVVDRYAALQTVENTDKRWVKRSFFWLFVVLPMGTAQLFALAALQTSPKPAWFIFGVVNAIALVCCSPFIRLWLRSRKTATRR